MCRIFTIVRGEAIPKTRIFPHAVEKRPFGKGGRQMKKPRGKRRDQFFKIAEKPRQNQKYPGKDIGIMADNLAVYK